MSTNNISAAHQSQSSTSRKVGRKRSWWPTECFSLQQENDTISPSENFYTTCDGCGWQIKSETLNATQLGHHHLQCSFTSPETLTRLLKVPSLLRAYRKLGASSECFEIPLTPAKLRIETEATAAIKRFSSAALKSETNEDAGKGTESEKEIARKVSRLHDLLTRLVVHNMLPFSILSRNEGRNELIQIVKLLYPRMERHVSTIARLAGKNIDGYYIKQVNLVKSAITCALRQTYGTLIFDGWTDANSENVVNVLLTITGVKRSRTTYFLRSVYTGSTSCNSMLYADIVDTVFKDFGDMSRITGVVSDNTASCIKAKVEIVRRHNHIISGQDQTHVANLLMQDVGELQWVSDILSTVSGVVNDLRKHSKLYFRFKQLKDQFNANLRNTSYITSNREVDQYGRFLPIRTAVLPVNMATTRFASAEGMLPSFIRGKPIYQNVVDCPDFQKNLYGNRNAHRRDYFEATVRSNSIFQKCLDIYYLFRLMRQYLRIFDDDSSVISEVYPATRQLEHELRSLPLTPYFTSERKNEVLTSFCGRLKEDSRKIPLLTPLYFVAYFLDIRSLNEDVTDYNAHVLKHMRAYVTSNVFPPTEKLPSSGGTDGAVHWLFEEVSFTSMFWKAQADNPTRREALMLFKNIPVLYWMQFKGNLWLKDFALRFLSVSPSSSIVERSFSLQGRIRSPSRNRLHPLKVEKMIFCAFNRALNFQKQRVNKNALRSAHTAMAEPEVLNAPEHTSPTQPEMPTTNLVSNEDFVSYFEMDPNAEQMNEDFNDEEAITEVIIESAFSDNGHEQDEAPLPEPNTMRRLFQ